MASEQTKEATVAIAKKSTIPTGGDDAIPLLAPSAGAVPVPTEAGGSKTLSDLLKREMVRSKSRPSYPSSPCQRRRGPPRTTLRLPSQNGVVRSLLQRAHLARKATRDLPWANRPSAKPSTSAPLRRGSSRTSRRWPKSQSKTHCPGTT
jgi:hypothetical protein